MREGSEFSPTSSLRRTPRSPASKSKGPMQPIPPPPSFSTAKTTAVRRRNTTSGVECPKCSERSRALRTGHDEQGRVIRQRRCPHGHEFATLEIAVPYKFYTMLEKMPPRPSATGKRLYRPKRTITVKVRATEYIRNRGERRYRTTEL